MVIECSRCHAVFSLPEGVVAAAGAPFTAECGRCHAFFEVVAPQAAAAAPAPDPPLASASVAVASPELPLAQAVSPEPAPPPAPSSPADRASRARWPVLLGILALASVAGIALHRRERIREVDEKVRQGREKMFLDDTRNLEEATKLFTEAARSAPGRALPEGERAFSLLLQAAAHKDLYERVPAPERDEEGRTAARLLQQGAAAARQAFADDKDDVAALRALAFAEAIAGTADQAVAHADQAERAAPRDAWVLYAKAAAAKASRDHEKAVQALSEARQVEPRLIRADVDLAGISLDRGDPAGARELLHRVLRRNPQHERARRILSLVPP
ncbi:MAG TPA: tetratricopeptide repeat protein [Myxococcales bacterium]|nr:tetratricopeptide repeat protein [Myxococcales bacterium]